MKKLITFLLIPMIFLLFSCGIRTTNSQTTQIDGNEIIENKEDENTMNTIYLHMNSYQLEVYIVDNTATKELID